MDVAVPALALFVFAIPGLVLRQSYLRGARNLPIPKRPFVENLSWGLISAIALHTAALCVVRWLDVGAVDYLVVTQLITNQFGNREDLARVSEAVFTNAGRILLYFASLCGVAVICGRWFHALVVRLGWSSAWPFTLPDGWHKKLTSDRYVADGKLYNELFAELTAVVEMSGTSYLFKGLLLGPGEIQFDEHGCPELFTLAFPARRKLVSKGKPFESIPSDVFILRYAETKTLNVRFFAIDPDEIEDEHESQEPVAPD